MEPWCGGVKKPRDQKGLTRIEGPKLGCSLLLMIAGGSGKAVRHGQSSTVYRALLAGHEQQQIELKSAGFRLMRSSPLQFYFADILYFLFYSVSPNLGHFGPKPVALLPRASVQFYAVELPVQPTRPVPSFQVPLFLQWMCYSPWILWLL